MPNRQPFTQVAVRRALAALVLFATAEAGPSRLLAQAPSGFDRPSVTIVGLDLSPHLAAALDAACGARCQSTGVGERADINTLGRWNYQSGMAGLIAGRAWAQGAPATIQTWLGRSGVSRSTILRLFNVTPDFNWSLDTLAARAQYAVTVEEAQRLLRAQRGVTRNEFRQVLPTYFFVFTVVGDTFTTRAFARSGGGSDSTRLYASTARVLGAVYRLGYPDIAAAGAALGPVSCFRGDVPATCEGAAVDARRNAFLSYEPPLTLITSFDEQVASVGASSLEASRRGLVANAIGALVARSAVADSRFASQGRVIASSPVAARIGRKEGVSPNNRRFFAIRRDSTPGRAARESRLGVFIPARVADNRRVVFTTGPNGSQIARLDSTTFKRIHGRGGVEANRGIMLREARYIGSFSAGAFLTEGLANPGLMFQAEYRAPGLPTGGYLGLTATFMARTEGDSAGQTVTVGDTAGVSIGRVGLLYGQEFFPARGFLRFRLQGEFGAAFIMTAGDTTAGQSAIETGPAGLYGGAAATLAIAPSYRWNIFATALMTKRFAKCDDAACPAPQGLGYLFGVRIEP